MKLKLPVRRFPRQFEEYVVEMMDEPQADIPLLQEDLANIRQLNRWLGAHRLVRSECKRFFTSWRGTTPCRVLDVCTGSADLPRSMVDWCRRQKIAVEIQATDKNPVMRQIACSLSEDYPEIHVSEADVTRLEFDHDSFDLVMCHLALHHFSAKQAVDILKDLWLVSRHTLLITDLHRNRLMAFAARAFIPWFTSNPMTRFDAALSARRAFSEDEMRRLAFHAEIPSPEIRRYFLGRQVLVASKAH